MKRAAATVVAVVAVVVTATPAWGVVPAPVVNAPAIPGNPVQGIQDIAGGLFGGASSAVASAMLDALSQWVAKGTASLVNSLAGVLDHETRPDLAAAWFGGRYQAMVAVALLLALPLVFASAISAIVRQDGRPLMRAVFVHLPLAGIGTGVAVSLTSLALGATDGLCAVVASGTGAHVLFGQLATTLDAGVPGAGGFGVIVVAVVVAFAAFLLTLELVVRSAAVYVAVLFLPLALAGLVWPATARWGKRMAEMLAALILSKFVIVAVISLAVAALSGGLGGQGLSGLLTGAALLLLAGIAPFALLRMVPIVEAGAVAHLEGTGRRMTSAPGHALEAYDQGKAGFDRLLHGSGAPGGGPTADSPSSIPVRADRTALAADGTQAAATGAVPAFAVATEVGAGAAEAGSAVATRVERSADAAGRSGDGG